MWECERWRLYKTTNTGKQHIEEHFLCRRCLAFVQLLEEMKTGSLFGYVQCDIEVPEKLKLKFDNFPPFFKNTLDNRSVIDKLMKNHAAKKKILASNSVNVDIQINITKRNNCYSSACVLSKIRSCLHQKYTVLLSTLQKNASTALCIQQWTREGNETKI